MSRALIVPEMLEGEFLFKRYGATVEDYDRAADEDTRLELHDGVLIMHSPANVRHESVFGFLLTLLGGFVSARGTGRVFGSRTPIYLSSERRFEPDLIFLKSAHLSRLGETAVSGPPDLTIEILSPATRDYDLGEKRDAYAAGGISEYWMVDLRARKLLIDRPAGTRHTELTGGRYACPIIPGFWLEVDWLWRDPPPDAMACLSEILRP